MNGNKWTLLVVSLGLQTLGVLGINALFFGVFDDLSVSRWVCWAYIHLTYALVVASIYSVNAVPNGHVYAYPKIMTATVYYFISLVLGVGMMVVNFESFVVPIIVFLVFTGLTLKKYLVLMATEARSIANETADRENARFIRRCAGKLSVLKEGTTSLPSRKLIEKAFDAVRSAEVATIPSVAGIEAVIEEEIDKLAAAGSVAPDALKAGTEKIVGLVHRRNAEIRAAK